GSRVRISFPAPYLHLETSRSPERVASWCASPVESRFPLHICISRQPVTRAGSRAGAPARWSATRSNHVSRFISLFRNHSVLLAGHGASCQSAFLSCPALEFHLHDGRDALPLKW